ncbi:MAG: Gfo/Idh/MocA family oxidoreductase [Alphaproteobacteria bacterium]
MTEGVKVSVIGCGHWGKNLVRNFHALGALHSVCDYDSATAQKFSAEYDVPALSFEEALQAPDVQALVLASPAPLHFKMAHAALQAGKDIYVEKPVCLRDEDAQALCALAAEKGRILMVGHLLHYHPGFLKLKEMAQAGTFGPLRYIYSNRLSFGKIRREENMLWSFAPHDVSMILSLAGDVTPETVEAVGSCQTHSEIEDIAAIHMGFPGGLGAHVNVSWMNPFKEQKLVVIGEEGMAVFDDQEGWETKLIHYPHKIEVTQELPDIRKADGVAVPLVESEPLRDECAHFLECVAARKTPRTDGEEGLRVLKVLNRADRAIKAQKQQKKAA